MNRNHPDNIDVEAENSRSDTSQQGLSSRVKSAVFWRSGSQILAQIITWCSTIAVISLLEPNDYGLFAMSQTLLVFLAFLNGYGFASSLIQAENVSRLQIRQAFGLMILLNVGLAIAQILLAPLVAAYYQEPIVANMLYVQALIYLSTPFIIVPEVLLSRQLDFRRQAVINLLAAIAGATTALMLALYDWGVWTLVYAPIAMFWTRAFGLVLISRFFYWPTFNLRGTGKMVSFGSAMLAGHFFWTIQSQSSIFIAGRYLETSTLGLYSTALFLAQIFAAKFIPPLNEVAFPAYAHLQNNPSRLSWSFLKAVRLIMVISCPLYIGLALTAEEIVRVLFVDKWVDMVPMLRVISLAMPFMTLQILFGPPLYALGKPRIAMRNAMFGAVMMSGTFFVAVEYGSMGMAFGWLVAFPALTIFTFWQAKKWINIDVAGLLEALWPSVSASIAMGAIVYLTGVYALPVINDIWAMQLIRLSVMVAVGGLSYLLMLRILVPETLSDMLRLVIKRKAPEPAAEPEQDAAVSPKT